MALLALRGSYFVEVVILSLDGELSAAFVDDLAHGPAYIDFLACVGVNLSGRVLRWESRTIFHAVQVIGYEPAGRVGSAVGREVGLDAKRERAILFVG